MFLIYRIAHQCAKAGLDKMPVVGQRISNAVFAHDDKRNAIDKPPGFIGVCFVKSESLIEKRFVESNNLNLLRRKKNLRLLLCSPS